VEPFIPAAVVALKRGHVHRHLHRRDRGAVDRQGSGYVLGPPDRCVGTAPCELLLDAVARERRGAFRERPRRVVIVQIPSRLPPELAVAVGSADDVTGLRATGDGSLPPNSCQEAKPPAARTRTTTSTTTAPAATLVLRFMS